MYSPSSRTPKWIVPGAACPPTEAVPTRWPLLHPLADGHLAVDRFEGRDESAAVVDRDHAAVGDAPGEGDHSVGGRAHFGAVRGRQVDAAMTGPVAMRGGDVRHHDAHRMHRPRPVPRGVDEARSRDRGSRARPVAASPGAAPTDGEDEQREDDRESEKTGHDPGSSRCRRARAAVDAGPGGAPPPGMRGRRRWLIHWKGIPLCGVTPRAQCATIRFAGP